VYSYSTLECNTGKIQNKEKKVKEEFPTINHYTNVKWCKNVAKEKRGSVENLETKHKTR
jgi:hypothetical protein